jgi:hypothetical protein
MGKRLLFSLVLSFSLRASGAECHLFYLTQSDMAAFKTTNETIRTVSRTINTALKTSFDFANKIDHYTLGLVSWALLGGAHSLDDIKPSQWDKLQIVGSVVYRDSPFSASPIRGAQVTISDGKSTVESSTGVSGEFAQHLYKLVPYSRIRLFPVPIFEFKHKQVKTLRIPLTVSVKSKVCIAEVKLSEAPLEPVVFIGSPE